MILVGIPEVAKKADMTGSADSGREIHRGVMAKDLTTGEAGLKYREIPANPPLRRLTRAGRPDL
jgi:hypothetical protein